ncbi:MAG: O-antigen ligase family protein [Acidimicrobiales bacterium]
MVLVVDRRRVVPLLEVAGAIAAIVIVAQRPDRWLLALVVGLPFQTVILAGAYSLGAPETAVRVAGYWKEVVALGLVLAAARARRHHRRGPDRIDLLALAYLGIVLLYFAFPALFVHGGSPFDPGPPTDGSILNIALRNTVLFVVIMLAVRRLDLPPDFKDRMITTVFRVGVVIAAIGIGEFVFSNAWNHLMVDTIQVPRFRFDIFDIVSSNAADVRYYSGTFAASSVRIGSVFLDPLECGTFLVLPLAIGLEHAVRVGRSSRFRLFAGMATIGVAILLTQTRGALLAVAIVAVCLARPSPWRSATQRLRLAVLAGVGLIMLIPVVVGTGLVERTAGALTSDDASTQVHVERSRAALEALVSHPLGRGLGTSTNAGLRFGVATALNGENFYLQVGNETGVPSMFVFVALVLAMVGTLKRRRHGASILSPAVRATFMGLSWAAILMHMWSQPAVALITWAAVGATIPRVAPGGDDVGPDHYTSTSLAR